MKRKSKTKTLNITVVDSHHHVLKPIWNAVQSGHSPDRGCKLLHFDSHPDMGCMGVNSEEGYSKQKMNKIKNFIPKLYTGKFNQRECLEYHGIATWVPTLVFQGLVDEVIWASGSWCDQFPVGSYSLIVGRSKVDGNLKIATPDDRKIRALAYWEADQSVCKRSELEMQRPWQLHVVRFKTDFTLKNTDIAKIAKICRNKPWILDIDEDYLSCQNPMEVEFKQMLGEDQHAKLKNVWNAVVADGYESVLEQIISDQTYKLPPARFHAHPHVKKATEEMLDKNNALFMATSMSAPKAKAMLNDFRNILLSVNQDNKEDDPLHIQEVWSTGPEGFIQDTAGFLCLPHHITTIPNILKMLHSTRDLFDAIRTAPVVATIATSRCDMYTPEAQAPYINSLVLNTLQDQWDDNRVYRRDITSGLSIDNEPPEYLDLFLGKKRRKLKPASR